MQLLNLSLSKKPTPNLQINVASVRVVCITAKNFSKWSFKLANLLLRKSIFLKTFAVMLASPDHQITYKGLKNMITFASLIQKSIGLDSSLKIIELMQKSDFIFGRKIKIMAEYDSRKISLNDGKEILLRNLNPTDVAFCRNFAPRYFCCNFNRIALVYH
jgi:hypothetical protein